MKKCIGCGEQIKDYATLCKECGAFQSSWKNQLRYFSTIVAALSFSFAGIAYLADTLPRIIKEWTWIDKAEVLTMSKTSKTTIVNVGDGTISVSHISIRIVKPNGKKVSTFIGVYKTISPGETVIVSPSDKYLEDLEQWKNRGKYKGKRYAVATAASNEEKVLKINKAKPEVEESCSFFKFAVPSDPRYSTYSDFLGKNMITYPIEAEVHYYSFKKKSYFEASVDGIGFLNEFRGLECKI